MQLIDGKAVAAALKAEIKAETEKLEKKPHLVAVIVGHDGASETYVAAKEKASAEVGFKGEVLRLEESTSEEELLKVVDGLNRDSDVDGFIVQMPLPRHIDEQKIIEAIDPRKDVDGFHPQNVGRMVIGLPAFVSATPYGICELLKYYSIPTEGKSAVVIGRSNIVGRPLSNLLSSKEFNATVTTCHSRTANLKQIVAAADIVIAALGKAEFVTADMVKEGAVVIDVGITRVKSDTAKSGWKLLGDVKFDEVAPKCSYITPVPGGVGPMTIVALLKNTLLAATGKIYR